MALAGRLADEQEQIRNPHLIYPGDVVRSTSSTAAAAALAACAAARDDPAVADQRASAPLEAQAIPSIPPGDIEPYLTRPLVTGATGCTRRRGDRRRAATATASCAATGDVVYVVGIEPEGRRLLVHLPARRAPLVNLDGTEVLGYENRFLGTRARRAVRATSRTVRIEIANEEILVGDRLLPAPRETLVNYVPHAPDTRRSTAASCACRTAASKTGARLHRHARQGRADGVEVGHVLAVYRVRAADRRSAPDRGSRRSSCASSTRRRPSRRSEYAAGGRRAHGPGVRVPHVRPRVVRRAAQHDRPGRPGDYARTP